MAFDQTTRNRLQNFVRDARRILTEEFTRQLQNDYGLDPISGATTPIENLGHLDDARGETARILRDTLAHYLASSPSGGNREALERITREQAFTVLNRLAALRMAEARGFLLESLANGYNSKGFQLYGRLAGTGLGETGAAYRAYLFSIFDEFSLDLSVLFDRFSPYGLLFPRETALLELLQLINASEITPLWGEDETIGWIYQYFNSKEERKKMRDESAAPRNSRELAVRNQFFTPRYVVEFLTDNTLGRIWYEMTKGETSLKEQCRYLVRRPNEIFLAPGEVAPSSLADEATAVELSQAELLNQPVYIPHRPLKDPREIRVLDPACGSMHFGLYAFDLLEVIYAEAWDLAELNGAALASDSAELKPLHKIYADKQAFLRDVPRLIIEYNLHGIDIDPRAVQIAGLSLWQRAQRAWQQQKVKPTDRPQIRRSNIVCAEPMPGEASFLQEFIAKHLSATPELRLLAQLVQHVFGSMQLAGEAGSLLKIEEEIAGVVAEAKKLWHKEAKPKQLALFADMAKPEQEKLSFDVAEITDEKFWEEAEERIYDALQAYAEEAEEGGYQRRLFAEDAARGFAFIDICRKKYDVVLMNPPFGWIPPFAKAYQDKNYPSSKNDIYCSIVERVIEITNKGAFIGSITSRTAFFLSSMRLWREHIILKKTSLRAFADLGFGVLDAAFVETAAFVLQVEQLDNRFINFFRINESIDKQAALLEFISSEKGYFIYAQDLKMLPGSPFSYWIPQSVRSLFNNCPTLEILGVTPVVGCATSDNERFVRNRWEVMSGEQRWVAYPKGGGRVRFHQDINLVVDWKNDGAAIKTQVATRYGSASRFVQNTSYYGQPGLTYPRVTVKGFSSRILPSGCIFSDVGQGIFSSSINYWVLLGLLNTELADFLMRSLTPSRMWEAGFVKKLPIPFLKEKESSLIQNLGRQLHDLIFPVDLYNETTSRFVGINFAQTNSLKEWLKEQSRLSTHIQDRFNELFHKLNNVVLLVYGLRPEEIQLANSLEFESDDIERDNEQQEDVELSIFSLLCSDIIPYLFGCIFGRWDLRFATGEKLAPELPDPFAPLPVCSPGMLQNAQGLPAKPADVPDIYPLRITWSGILVDDPGHPDDIERRLHEVLQVIWQDRADAIEQEACQILEIESLREYFSKPPKFFADHLQRYSKSRRQAPIYWPISTTSGAYTIWLYYHRLNDQTLYTCINDFVEPKLRQVNEIVTRLRVKSNRSRDEESQLETKQNLAQELADLRDELLRLATLPWRPNLNDGVQITAAPLWRLFRLPKWQKTLKETWEKLKKGDYDWAHLAYTIWPARVKEKCKKDKSLAIAHDLEALYQEPPVSESTKKKREPKKAKADKNQTMEFE